MPLSSRLLAAGAAGLIAAGGLITPAPAAPTAAPEPAATAAAARSAKTSAAEARRVDRVPTPKLDWYSCYQWAQCATAEVPLDYDNPRGRQVTLALVRVRAKDQDRKIGSLFVNPGGPGAQATFMALAAPYFLSEALLERFDIVGVDPRGIGASDQVQCFRDTGKQTRALKPLNTLPFPVGAKQVKSYLKSARKLARGCSTTGRELAGAMSTAEVARDMDVMRRAVGDTKLTYLGFSYGSALGQYYANMFPDRFRALAVDGTINPRAWVGTRKTGKTNQDQRLRSADGAYRALIELLHRCERAGSTKCAFAGPDTVRKFGTIARRLKRKPLNLGEGMTFTYPLFVTVALGALYDTQGGDMLSGMLAELWLLTDPNRSATPDEIDAAGAAMRQRLTARRAQRGFPYDNSLEAYSAVMCTDGRHPASAKGWARQAAAADRRAPYFGRPWAWASVPCARNAWTVRDEDAYTGPFNRRTARPVLIVGSYWDPATNYRDAVKAADLLPNSRLLSSDNWGHTAYGTSACATGHIDRYLLYRDLPKAGTVCHGDVQPYTRVIDKADQSGLEAPFDLSGATPEEIVAHGLPAPGEAKLLPPVDRTPFAG
ncbi:TAP-like protein [Krasilnikovia cinnamomea]|uniref:TAP-like protein n=1 Tax=Krasilnikovia cinnamomea TaxID=349313 RepID=A0A4Q7ZTL3_9ACTN|nr:alpha/beta hydrolase [Krasilnikovia cinnamomea]RZU54588.1 TAP-like protein [Krasilnikovia cinnamomea]